MIAFDTKKPSKSDPKAIQKISISYDINPYVSMRKLSFRRSNFLYIDWFDFRTSSVMKFSKKVFTFMRRDIYKYSYQKKNFKGLAEKLISDHFYELSDSSKD